MCSFNFAQAQQSANDGESGLSLPRFVSLRSNHINARSGPGSRYPIEWVYMQKSAPVEVVAEFELWRKIKDWQGSETWVHKSMLVGKRFAKVTTLGENNIYAKQDDKSKVVAKVEDETIAEIVKCTKSSDFCLVKFNSVEGWMPRQSLYGIYEEEQIES